MRQFFAHIYGSLNAGSYAFPRHDGVERAGIMNYFVIGERELVLGFNLVGVQGKAVSNRQDALDSFNLQTGQVSGVRASVESERPNVLILTEDVADMLSDEVREWQMKGKSPLIVEVPGLGGHIPGRKTLTDSIREAVGINV